MKSRKETIKMENDEGSDDKFNLICNMKASTYIASTTAWNIYTHTFVCTFNDI